MNAQQARIWANLDEAADQFEETGMVDLVLQTELATDGYPLCQLEPDLTHIINKRNNDAA